MEKEEEYEVCQPREAERRDGEGPHLCAPLDFFGQFLTLYLEASVSNICSFFFAQDSLRWLSVPWNQELDQLESVPKGSSYQPNFPL